MTKEELITKLESLLQNSNPAEVSGIVKALRKEYLLLIEKIKNEQIEDFVAAGGIRKEYEYRKDANDIKIENLFNQHKEAKRKFDIQKSESEKKNLLAKKEIIEQINNLIQEENIGKAITTFNELNKTWKEIGPVHPDKFGELQNEFSKARDNFYYNLKIYKEIEGYDRKKNWEQKMAIIQKIGELATKDSIKEIDELLRVFRTEWDEIGPVVQDKWPQMRDEYRKVMEKVYERLNYLKELRAQQRQENFKLKSAISDKIEQILVDLPTTVKGWNNRTEEIKKLQEEWAAIGKAEKGKEEQAYDRLRNLSNRFFDAKREYFSGIKEVYEKNKKLKEDLIIKAEALKENTQWKETSNALINLQKEWQKVGPTARHIENKLWARFREACNYFFNNRNESLKQQEEAFIANTERKKQLLEQLKAFTFSGNNVEDRQKLIDFKNQWAAIGPAISAERKVLNNEFFELIDSYFDKLQLDKKDYETQKIQNKIDRILEFDNAAELLKKEVDFLRKKIEEAQIEIIKLENNLGFLRNAESLKTEALVKIEKAKKNVTDLKERSKLFQKALRNLTKPADQAKSELAEKA